MKHIIYYIFVFALFSSCKNNVSNVDDNSGAESKDVKSKISQKLSEDANIKKAEGYLIELSEEIENFGGVYLDREGNIIISIKSSNLSTLNKEIIRNKVKDRFQAHSIDITIEVADYTYSELVEYRDKIDNGIEELDVIYMDLSEDKIELN